ncbi:FKBP-type peptidyl-prolyl cis-trans isomerase [Spirosoma aerophilum]
MRILHFILLGALLLSGLASCKQENIDATNTASTLLANQADIKTYTSTPAFQSYIVSQGMSATTTSSGLYFATTQPNSATTVDNYGKEVEFNYTLYVLNGPSNGASTTVTSGTTTSPVAITAVKVDSAFASTSAFFPLFEKSLKPGLEEGLRRMHEGEKAILIMPSLLGYGGVTNGNVPANSPIRFDVTLKRARTEAQQINEYMAANKLTPTRVTTSGLRFIKTLSVATGDTIKANSTVTINYVAKQLRAQTAVGFDSTKAGVDPYNLVGFKEGLVGMKVGEKATFIFPSSIGFGTKGLVNTETGLYKVAPNTPLRFDVEVVKINL